MIIYYTDGSCSPNPGPGGYSVIRDMQPALFGHEPNSTNIRMEGKALIAALQDADGTECEIYTAAGRRRAAKLRILISYRKSVRYTGRPRRD